MIYKILFVLVAAFHAVAAVPVLKPDESVATLDDKSFAAPETRAMKLSKLEKLVQELSVGKKDVKAKKKCGGICIRCSGFGRLIIGGAGCCC